MRPVSVAAVVTGLHLVWVLVFFTLGGEVRDFARIGVDWVTQSTASEVIRLDPSYDYPPNPDPARAGEGYDGQFYYYLALDPENARFYMDLDGYRYLRPLYPAVALGLSGGDPSLIPWAMLLINLLAGGLGTLALAAWLRRRGQPAWPALLYGLSPGLLVAVQRDLTEPLAYALVAAAILALDGRRSRAWMVSAAVFSLAVLARQTAALFVPPFALGLLLAGQGPLRQRAHANWRRAAGFAVTALLPYATYHLAISAWLGDTGSGQNFTAVPMAGFLAGDGSLALERHGVSFLTVGIPVLIWMGLALALLRRRVACIAALCVLLNGLALVVFNVDSNAYTARGRGAVGVALALVLCIPALSRINLEYRKPLLVSATLWLVMLPVVAVYGLTSGAV